MLNNTLFTGKVLHHLTKVDSTNTYVQRLLANTKPPDGLVVFADQQDAGRGQIGATWLSEPRQNIILSVLYYPRFLAASHLFHLNKAIALAVRTTVQAYTKQVVVIKWPNDIYIGDEKIAGLLIETMFKGSHLQHVIIGIGCNVNQTEFEATLFNPTSLAIAEGKQFLLLPIIEHLCIEIEHFYFQLKNNEFVKIDTNYLRHLYGLNKQLNFEAFNNHFKGTIRGISATGKLQIETENNMKEFDVKEIKFLL